MRWILTFLCGLLIGCSGGQDRALRVRHWMEPNGKIKVLATTGMVAALVAAVGGDRVDVLTLIEPGLDPHSYQLVKGDIEKFQRADLIVYNGLGLEHGASLFQQLMQSPKALSLGAVIEAHYPDKLLMIKGQRDPHIWMDVALFVKVLPAITEALATLEPASAALFMEHQEQATKQLLELDHQLYVLLQSVPEEKRYLVTSHDAFNYFARAYLATPQEMTQEQWQPRFQAPEGLAPESQLSSMDIKFLMDHLLHYKICVLFPESNVSQDSIRKIVEASNQVGVQLVIAEHFLYADAMGITGSDGDTYAKMMSHNGRIIHDYLMREGICSFR